MNAEAAAAGDIFWTRSESQKTSPSSAMIRTHITPEKTIACIAGET